MNVNSSHFSVPCFCGPAWSNSALVVYTDNNAVRDAMISCHTSNVVARRVLVAALSIESEYLSLHPGMPQIQIWQTTHHVCQSDNCKSLVRSSLN